MAGLAGKWCYASSDNLDAYINATVKEERRAQAKTNALNHVIELKVDGNNFTYTTTTPEASNTMTFTPGQQFDYVMSSGRVVKATWSTASDTKGIIDFSDGAIKAQAVAEITGGELSMTISVGDIKNVQKYKKC